MPNEIDQSEIERAQVGSAPSPPGHPDPVSPAPPPEPPSAVEQPAVAAPPPPPVPAALPPVEAPAPPPAQPKEMDAEWPHVGYTGPQPWEADNPPALTHNHLMVGSGSTGEEVVQLGAYLEQLGYATSISQGVNPHAVFDRSVGDAVRAFCDAYGVEEDPAVRRARTDDTVGPWLWEALIRAVHKKLAGLEA